MVIDKYVPMGHNQNLQTIVETEHYAARAKKILSANEMDAVVNIIAATPLAGDVIPGTGGIRKIRFAKGGRGKSGGVRIIYYYYDIYVPIIIMDIYAKSDKGNLSQTERNSLRVKASEFKKEYRKAKK